MVTITSGGGGGITEPASTVNLTDPTTLYTIPVGFYGRAIVRPMEGFELNGDNLGYGISSPYVSRTSGPVNYSASFPDMTGKISLSLETLGSSSFYHDVYIRDYVSNEIIFHIRATNFNDILRITTPAKGVTLNIVSITLSTAYSVSHKIYNEVEEPVPFLMKEGDTIIGAMGTVELYNK